MKPKCFIDFDGTIVSNKKRLYYFYINNIPTQFQGLIDINDFWTLKRYGIHEIEWLNNKLNANINRVEYDEKKKELIETEQYIQFDELFPFSISALKRISKDFSLILVSRRSNPQQLMKEIEIFNITSFFTNFIILPHGNQTKANAITQQYQIQNNDILIGDTEDDIKSGCLLKINTYFVLSGIRDKWILNKFPNDIIFCVNSIDSL